ncbi:MAG TPA: SGNH/GDSL hydrolase family protein [Thermomicrobiales bacterium]|nr:SGNH/GDSL hydrolase family protein [Thermomicrobiales bacterium]
MVRLARFTLSVAMIAMMVVALVPTTSAAPLPGIYLALGDSLLAPDGFGASAPDKAAFALFFDYLQQHGAADQVVNLARGGEWSGGFSGQLAHGDRIDPASQLAQALDVIDDRATDVTVISLSLGGNDVGPDSCFPDHTTAQCRSDQAANVAAFAWRLPAILQELRPALARDPGQERVLVVAPFNPFGGMGDDFSWFFDTGGWESWVDAGMAGSDGAIDCATPKPTYAVDDTIACVAPRHGARVVDLWTLFDDQAALYTGMDEAGDTHPNDIGHSLFAAAMIDAYNAK